MKIIVLLLMMLFSFNFALAKNEIRLESIGIIDLDRIASKKPEVGGAYAYHYYIDQGLSFEKDLPQKAGDQIAIATWSEQAEYAFINAIDFAPSYGDRAYAIFKAWHYEMFPIDTQTGDFDSPIPYSPKSGFQKNAGALYKAFLKTYIKIKKPGTKTKGIKAIMDAVMTPDY